MLKLYIGLLFFTLGTILSNIGFEAADRQDVLSLLIVAKNARSKGMVYDALDALLKAQKLVEDSLGETDALTATVFNNLSTVYEDLGRYSAAEKVLLKALSVDQRIDPNSSKIPIRLNNLGLLYREMDRLQEAQEVLEGALFLDRKAGPKSEHVATVQNNLATLYWDLGLYDKAAEALEEAIQIEKQYRSLDDPIFGLRYMNLSSIYRNLKKFEQARELVKMAIDNWKNKYGSEDYRLASAYITLALLLEEEGNLAESERTWQLAYSLRKPVYPSDHPSLADIVAGRARVAAYQLHWKEANEGLRDAAKIYLRRQEIYDCAFQIDCIARGQSRTEKVALQDFLRTFYELHSHSLDADPVEAFSLAQQISLSSAAEAISSLSLRNLGDAKFATEMRRRQDLVTKTVIKSSRVYSDSFLNRNLN